MNVLFIKNKVSNLDLPSKIENYTIKTIEFDFDNEEIVENLDTYVTSRILPLIHKVNFDLYIIDAALSENFDNLYGLYLSHHIRLDIDLNEKRLLPIIIVSKRDECFINKLSAYGRILFTKGISVVEPDEKEVLKKVDSLISNNIKANINIDFLIKIYVPIPDSSHMMANKWAINKWAECLCVKGDSIKEIEVDIKSRLDFKYLQNKYQSNEDSKDDISFAIEHDGRVLLIDDEWNMGWKEVFNTLMKKINSKIVFEAVEEDYKKKSEQDILDFVKLKIEVFNPDTVLLDLRLHNDDESRESVDTFTGIKIIDMIKSINPGIQIIMLTATSRSTILDKLYKKGIFGFIKKEHPENYLIDTADNISALIELMESSFDRKYLKDIWEIREKVVKILETNPFLKFHQEEITHIEDYNEIIINDFKSIFNILDRDIDNKFVYAMLTMIRCIENINHIFVKEPTNNNDPILYFWDSSNSKKIELLNIVFNEDKEIYECSNGGKGTLDYKSTRNKIHAFMCQRLKINNNMTYDDITSLIDFRNDYIHANKNNIEIGKTINQDNIKKWFKSLFSLYFEISQYDYTNDIPIQILSEKREVKKLRPSTLKRKF